MAKIPTADSLQEPQISADRRTALIDKAELSAATAPATALVKAGEAMHTVAEDLRKQQEEADEFEARRRVIGFGLDHDRDLEERARGIQGDGAGFTDQSRASYDEGARGIVARARQDGISERALRRLDAGLYEQGRRHEWRAYQHELGARDRAQTEAVQSTLRSLQERAVAAPGRLNEYLDEGNRLIDTSRLSASARRAERERFRLETARAAIEQRASLARTLEEQEAIFRDLRTLPRAAGGPQAGAIPSSELMADDEAPEAPRAPASGPVEIRPAPGNRTPVGVSPRTGAVEGIVLHHTSGSTLDSALSQNRIARTGYNYYVDRDGQVYQFAPDDQTIAHVMPSGHRDRRPDAYPNLSSANTIGIGVVARNDSDITDAQRETLGRLTGQLVAQHGISRENIVGHGELQHTREESEGSFAREYREGRVRVAQRSGTASGAIPGEGFTFSDTAPYPHLSVSERQTILNTLRTRFRASTIPMLRQGLESIVNGDEPATDRSGRTAMDWARLTMTPLQLQSWERQWTRARALRDTTQPLYAMPITEMGEYVANIPDPAVRGPVTRRADRILELYDRDPARAVSGGDLAGTDRRPPVSIDPTTGDPGVVSITGNEDIRLPAHPAVRAAYAMIRASEARPSGAPLSIGTGAGGNLTMGADPEEVQRRRTRDNWRLLIDGRLAAQRQAGVVEDRLAPITREEARRLLDLPENVADNHDFRTRLNAAADRANEWFGPYARMALQTAIGYRADVVRHEQSSAGAIAGRLLQRYLSPEGLSRADMQRFNAAMDLDRQRSLWSDEGTAYQVPSPELGGLTGTGLRPLQAPAMAQPPPRGWFGSAPAQPSMWAGAQVSGDTERRTMAPGVSIAHPKPPPEEIDYLLQHPEIQPRFDQDYGPGAAAFYLQGQGQGQR